MLILKPDLESIGIRCTRRINANYLGYSQVVRGDRTLEFCSVTLVPCEIARCTKERQKRSDRHWTKHSRGHIPLPGSHDLVIISTASITKSTDFSVPLSDFGGVEEKSYQTCQYVNTY